MRAEDPPRIRFEKQAGPVKLDRMLFGKPQAATLGDTSALLYTSGSSLAALHNLDRVSAGHSQDKHEYR